MRRNQKRLLATVASLAASMGSDALAQTKTWIGGDSTWSSASNWSPAGAPTAANPALLNQGAFTASLDTIASTATLTIDGGMTLSATSGNNIATSFTALAPTGAGTILQSAGLHSVTGDVNFAETATGAGYYQLDGGTLSSGGLIRVGRFGVGTMIQNGGSVTCPAAAGGLLVGSGTTGLGTYRLNAGTITSTGGTFLGNFGSATFVQSGGVHQTGTLSLGAQITGRSLYQLIDGTLSVTNGVIVADFGQGETFLQQGGVVTTPRLDIGNRVTGSSAYALGTYSISAGSLTPGLVQVGIGGIGSFVQSGGNVNAATLNVGAGFEGSGDVIFSGGTFSASSVQLGSTFLSTGRVQQSGGAVSIGSFVTTSDRTHTYFLSGGSLTVASSFLLKGTSFMTFSGGTCSLGNLSVVGGSSHINVTAGAERVLRCSSLAMEPQFGTYIDLNDNDMIVGPGTGKAAIENYVKLARNGGAWNVPGITSTSARTNPATGLGVLSGTEYTSVGGTGTFSGQTYAAADTLVKYTWNGDANLDGRVTFDDYVKIDTGFNTGLTGWLNGDFNYSGAVNFDDYVLIDIAFNQQSGTLGRAMNWISGDDRPASEMATPGVETVIGHLGQFGTAYGAAFLAAVPEPVSSAAQLLGVLTLCSRSLSRRARRKG